MINSQTTAKELRVMIEAGEANKTEALEFLKARIDAKTAKGKAASFPTRKLYEELSGTHVKGTKELSAKKEQAKPDATEVKPTKTEAKPDKKEFDADEYRASCEQSSVKQLKARLNKVHLQAKREILEQVIDAMTAKRNEPDSLQVIRDALASGDEALKNEVLAALIKGAESK